MSKQFANEKELKDYFFKAVCAACAQPEFNHLYVITPFGESVKNFLTGVDYTDINVFCGKYSKNPLNVVNYEKLASYIGYYLGNYYCANAISTRASYDVNGAACYLNSYLFSLKLDDKDDKYVYIRVNFIYTKNDSDEFEKCLDIEDAFGFNGIGKKYLTSLKSDKNVEDVIKAIGLDEKDVKQAAENLHKEIKIIMEGNNDMEDNDELEEEEEEEEEEEDTDDDYYEDDEEDEEEYEYDGMMLAEEVEKIRSVIDNPDSTAEELSDALDEIPSYYIVDLHINLLKHNNFPIEKVIETLANTKSSDSDEMEEINNACIEIIKNAALNKSKENQKEMVEDKAKSVDKQFEEFDKIISTNDWSKINDFCVNSTNVELLEKIVKSNKYSSYLANISTNKNVTKSIAIELLKSYFPNVRSSIIQSFNFDEDVLDFIEKNDPDQNVIFQAKQKKYFKSIDKVIDSKKDNGVKMSNNSKRGIVQRTSDDFNKAKYLAAGMKLNALLPQLIIEIAKQGGLSEGELATVEKVMNNKVTKGLLGFGVGTAVAEVSALQENSHVQAVGDNMRQFAMAEVGVYGFDELVGRLMELAPNLSSLKQIQGIVEALPPAEKNVRIADQKDEDIEVDAEDFSDNVVQGKFGGK